MIAVKLLILASLKQTHYNIIDIQIKFLNIILYLFLITSLSKFYRCIIIIPDELIMYQYLTNTLIEFRINQYLTHSKNETRIKHTHTHNLLVAKSCIYLIVYNIL